MVGSCMNKTRNEGQCAVGGRKSGRQTFPREKNLQTPHRQDVLGRFFEGREMGGEEGVGKKSNSAGGSGRFTGRGAFKGARGIGTPIQTEDRRVEAERGVCKVQRVNPLLVWEGINY